MADISKLKLPNGDEYDLKDVDGRKESYLTWGGKHFSASYGPIDAAMIGALGANRFAFLKAAGLTIEYSTDGGTNWVDYGASNENKTGLFGKGYSFYLGKHSTKGSSTLKDMLRITIATGSAQIYTILNKIAIYMSTSGNTVQVKMEKALENAPTNFTTHLDWTGISGWSGWNILNISSLTTYGNAAAYQYGRIRFIFKQTAINNGSYSAASISRIMGFGGVGWVVPSNMAADGHLYSYDNAQNATFPAQITATQFNGNINATNITGTVAIDHGGTGKTTANDAANALLSGLPDWTSDPSDDVKLIRRDTGGSSTFGQIKFLTVWNYIKTKISSVLGLTATTYGGSAAKVNNHTVNSDVPANAKFTDTTYQSKAAASDGTEVSLVTTGQKYIWNNKTSNTGTVTSVAISNDTNGGLTVSGSPITSSGTVKLKHTNQVTAQNTQAIYPIKIDVNGHISAYGSAVTPLTASSTLDATKLNGTIPTACLPSYVDDVLQYTAKANFPTTGETGKIYVDKTTNLTWRWGGSSYVEISPSLALGTTSSTAFRGDYGNSAYAHAVTNKGSAFSSGLYKITTNSEGHVTAATAVQKSDITGLGIPGTDNDTKNTAGSTDSSKKLFLIGAETQAANPQTYSQDTAYVGTDGKLYSNSKVVLTGGSNASSAVTITPSTTDVYSMTNAGSVTAGTKNVPTKIDTSKFSGGSFTRGTFSQGTLPTLTFAMDTTDTKKLKITFSQGTLPTHAADSFTAAALQSGFYTAGTANTPTAVTLPGRSSVIKAWTGYTAATAAAQTFTGSSS